MSDMHGRKREKTTEEIVKARKLKEATKIKEYNTLVEQCRAKMDKEEYDNDAFSLTTQIVQWNPDYYTVWNYRRVILREYVLHNRDEDEQQKIYQKELLLFMQLIRVNPKSYWLWNHRFWCLQHMPKPDWEAELGLVEKMLTMDARNFHGWDYRRYVVSHLRKNAKDEQEIAKIVQHEYEFTTRKINQSFSNYSAWHQRSKLLPEIVMHMTTEEKNVIAMNELDLVKNAIYTDPEDQSAWLYYWWLLGRAPDYVECMGAYSLESKPTAIYLGFNDMIKFIEPPTVLDEQSNRVPSRLYPLCSKDGESASTWMLAVDVANAKTISLQSNAILPSTSAKSISQKTWQVEIKKMMQGSVIQERVALVKSREWQPVSIKMYKDPILEDQSAWFALDKVQLLKDEIETVRELLEIEPDSAWAMQTLVHFLSQMQLRSQIDKESIYAEIADILDKLMDIDKDRRFRYQDQKNKLLFDQATQGPLKDESIATYNEILDLDQVEGHVPLLSKLLFL